MGRALGRLPAAASQDKTCHPDWRSELLPQGDRHPCPKEEFAHSRLHSGWLASPSITQEKLPPVGRAPDYMTAASTVLVLLNWTKAQCHWCIDASCAATLSHTARSSVLHEKAMPGVFAVPR